MAEHIVSIDAGNGGTTGLLAQKKGYKSVRFPSVRAVTTGESLGLGAGFEMEYEWVSWGGHKYLIGDDVFISRRAIERHQGAFRYGDEFHLFLIAVALGKLAPKGGTVDLTLFAPPGLFFDAKENIEKRFAHHKNRVAISFKDDKKPRVFEIERITVHPEGLGALLAFALDEQGKAVGGDLLEGENIVLDGGMYTLDALQVSNGQFNPESLQSATWEGQGIRAHLLDPILNVVKKSGSDFELLTTDDIDRALRRGILEDNWTLISGAASIDLKPAVEKYSERYASWASNNIIDGGFNSLRGVKSVILVGGWTVFVQDYLKKWYSTKILSYESHKQVKQVLPVEANAVGGLRLALSRTTK